MKTLAIILFVVSAAFGQSKDYRIYHTQINKAEELFFKEQNTDSALYYYDKTFSEYDFIFLKDIVNAMQIAKFSKKDYRKYFPLAFRFGLKIWHLNYYPIFKDNYLKLVADKKLHQVYLANRQLYLEKIDYKYLDWTYKLRIKEVENSMDRYTNPLPLDELVQRLRDSVLKKGFPGDRLIGIEDSTVFKDGHRGERDFMDRPIKKKKNTSPFDDAKNIAQVSPLYFLVNNGRGYNTLKDVFVKELIKGNIHPRDIGSVFDYSLGCSKLKGAYRLNPFVPDEVYKNAGDKLINEMRKELYIVPLEIDQIKKQYEKKYGFRLFSGFMGCR